MRYIKKKKKNRYNTKRKTTTILIDDRERNPWTIEHPDFIFETKRLLVGDYTIKGYEDTIAIEKKSGIVELISNLSGKDRPRFKRFLEKLSQYKTKCIIIEDSLSHVESAFYSCKKTHLTPDSIYHWISVINLKYNIPTLFIGKDKRRRDTILVHIFNELVRQIESTK